jgi:hypothetical protein
MSLETVRKQILEILEDEGYRVRNAEGRELLTDFLDEVEGLTERLEQGDDEDDDEDQEPMSEDEIDREDAVS